MKRSALLAVAAPAFSMWAWHVVPDYVSSPRAAAIDSCRCQGCGCKGGPGWRGQNGQCVSHANLTKDCGSPLSTRCTYEGAQQVCRRGCSPSRARRERPWGSPAEKSDEIATGHSITSSARASKLSGTVRPSAFAVLRLMTSSYLVGACTGRSAGFSPLRMRST